MATSSTIQVKINGDASGVVAAARMAQNALKSVASVAGAAFKGASGAVGILTSALGSIMGGLTSLKALALGAFAGWGVATLASDFLAVGGRMEQMRISLDTLMKSGRRVASDVGGGISVSMGNAANLGSQKFEELNKWALKMPVDTEKAIQSFVQMKAMGLDPTLKDMTTLVDTVSALGGQSDALGGVARALGQIKTKGKVSAEELMQLAERGIPVYDILRDKLKLTADQMADMGSSGVSADQAITAIMEGLNDRFGGQSKKMEGTWVGLMESFKYYWVEFQRLVMDSGVMSWLESKLSAINGQFDTWLNTGQLKAWAQETSDSVTGAFDWIWEKLSTFYQWWLDNNKWITEDFRNIWEWVKYLGKQLGEWLQANLGKMYDWWIANNAAIIQGLVDTSKNIGSCYEQISKFWAANKSEYWINFEAAVLTVGDGFEWLGDNIKLTWDYWSKFWDSSWNEIQLFKDFFVSLYDTILGIPAGIKAIWDSFKGLPSLVSSQAWTNMNTYQNGANEDRTLGNRSMWSFGDSDLGASSSSSATDGYGKTSYSSRFGSYAIGTDYVPRDGLYNLHRGEKVVTAEDNRQRGAGGLAVTINVPNAAPKTGPEWRAIVRDFIAPELRQLQRA